MRVVLTNGLLASVLSTVRRSRSHILTTLIVAMASQQYCSSCVIARAAAAADIARPKSAADEQELQMDRALQCGGTVTTDFITRTCSLEGLNC